MMINEYVIFGEHSQWGNKYPGELGCLDVAARKVKF